MTQYWYKPKKYGYGAQPITWQGWVAILLLVMLLLAVNYADFPNRHAISLRNWLRFGIDFIEITALFLILIKDKVEGGLRWRWGD
jgi:general stress protein CsbA